MDPNGGARNIVDILSERLEVDLITLVKPNRDCNISLQQSIRVFCLAKHLGARVDREDDVESTLFRNQARVGKLHPRGIGRGA